MRVSCARIHIFGVGISDIFEFSEIARLEILVADEFNEYVTVQ